MKCGAGKVVPFATPGSAPQRVLRGGVGSRNRRRPLAELSAHSKVERNSGPLRLSQSITSFCPNTYQKY